jgi:hypothetical protein
MAVATGGAAHACSCINGGPFIQMADRSDVVIHAKVLDYQWREFDSARQQQPESMRLEVKAVYQGTVKTNPLTVWGDNGLSCRPYVTQFPIGTEWVLALRKDDGMETIAPPQRKDDFAISICGEYWLKVQGDNVEGYITQNDHESPAQVMSLSNLRELLGDRTLSAPTFSALPSPNSRQDKDKRCAARAAIAFRFSNQAVQQALL